MAKIPLPWHFRIKQAIDHLESSPYIGEKMRSDMKDKRKITIWPYRIVYKIDEKKHFIVICEADHRGNVSYA
ncbi:MAG: type II toxin-antitoxin system RelE/ParE family toxin [bacterium]|nr:type II toxin-antitoxin system RelE/ParE family toxin [bacterium]